MQPLLMRSYSKRLLLFCLTALTCLAFGRSALAAPEAHILRVDPRTSQESGNPILTTLVEVVQSKRVSDATAPCAGITGNGQYDCMSQALEKPFALYTPFPFPEQNAIFTVTVDGSDLPAKFVSQAKWGDSLQQPGVGTAWLILIDADKRMGASFNDAKQVAERFVSSMGANDLVDIIFFNDRQLLSDSKWLTAAQKNNALNHIRSVGSTFPNSGRNRTLFSIVKSGATDGFKALGNAGETVKVPLHQAMVVLSNGYGGADALTNGAGALQLQQYLTGGRFPEDNTALPKAPVPVISILFPHKSYDEYRQASFEFMQNLANPQIGGFFSIVQPGQGDKAGAIVNSVRQRFSKMHIVKWRVSCIAPSVTQTFKLVFNNVKPPILGDNTFKDVPVGIDPSTWPLDVNMQYSADMAKRQGGVYAGGTFKVYGNFCWGGEKGRAEVYFLPAGQQVPAALSGANIEEAKRAQQQLIAMGMKGSAIEVSDSYAEFEAPDKDKVLHGSGDQAVVRVILFDNKAKRTSGVTSDSILQLKGTSPPFPILYVLGGGVFVVLILLVIVLKAGGGKKRGGQPPPPAMGGYGPPPGGGYGGPPPGGGYGGPPGGGYGGPPGGGYGGPPPGGGYGGPPPGGGGYGGPPGGGYGAPAQPEAALAAPPPAAPAPNPEFMYGSGGGQPPFGLTNDLPAAAAPPPDPYAQTAAAANRATLQGSAGVFTVLPGMEMKAGRDGAQCGILLTEPRVSGVHSTLKIENGQLLLRDDNSNNGTMINGNRLSPGVWTPVQDGSLVRFGPVEFSVRIE